MMNSLRLVYNLIELNNFNGNIIKLLKHGAKVYVLVKGNGGNRVFTPFGDEVDNLLVPKSKLCRNAIPKHDAIPCTFRCACSKKAYFWFCKKGVSNYIVEREIQNRSNTWIRPYFGTNLIFNLEILCLHDDSISTAMLVPFPYRRSYVSLGIEPSIVKDGKLVPVVGLGKSIAEFHMANSYRDVVAFWKDDHLAIVRISLNDCSIKEIWDISFGKNIIDVTFWKSFLLVLVQRKLYIISIATREKIIEGKLNSAEVKFMESAEDGLYLASENTMYYLEALPEG